MPYDSIIDRDGAEALIPEQVVNQIFKESSEQSTFMRLARRLPNMARSQLRLPVLSALPTAYWVNPSDTGLKQTSSAEWENKFINAEELAVILPIPERVIEDADYDIEAEVTPLISEAIGKAVDEAAMFGTNAPASFPTDLVAAAVAAGQSVTLGTGADLYEDLLGENGVISLLEADGYIATGHVAAMSMRGKLRGVRSSEGELIFQSSMQGSGNYQLDGAPILFPRNGAFDSSKALLIAGQWDKLVYSVRSDIRTKLLDQAVIQGPDGSIIYNLAQQDMVALRVTFVMGWQVPNPVNRLNANSATRYPISILKA